MRPVREGGKRTNEALRLSEQRLRAAFELHPGVLLILAPDARVLDVHVPAGAGGLSLQRDELIGRSFWHTPWWRDHLDLPRVWADCLRLSAAAPGPSCREDWFTASNGEDRCAQATLTAHCGPDGALDCYIVRVADVTERRRAESAKQVVEARLRDQQRLEAIGTLAGGVAHDFNSIIGVVLGNLAMVREAVGPGHAALRSLDLVGEACQHARSLAQQILLFGRSDSQHPLPVLLSPLLEDTLALLRATMPSAVQLELSLGAADACVLAHATQLRQVLLNLCTNAWHALPDRGGRIEVGVAREGEHEVMLWVADNGIGMDDSVLPHIFEPHFSTKPMGQGTGLGLSMVRSIVADHGGRIVVSSTPGEGSRFSLYFPSADFAALPTPPLVSGLQPLDGDGRLVLYVDDDESMVLVVESLLSGAGFAVSSASSVTQALALLAEWRWQVDLVITDQDMPGDNGLELVRQLARHAPGIPVILSSGYVSDELCAQASALGVRQVMRKEHTLDDLARLVRRTLAGTP